MRIRKHADGREVVCDTTSDREDEGEMTKQLHMLSHLTQSIHIIMWVGTF